MGYRHGHGDGILISRSRPDRTYASSHTKGAFCIIGAFAVNQTTHLQLSFTSSRPFISWHSLTYSRRVGSLSLSHSLGGTALHQPRLYIHLLLLQYPCSPIPISSLHRSLPAHHYSKRASSFLYRIPLRSLTVRGSRSMSYNFFSSGFNHRHGNGVIHYFLTMDSFGTRYTQMFYLGSFSWMGRDGIAGAKGC